MKPPRNLRQISGRNIMLKSTFSGLHTVMLSPRGQNGLEGKILASASKLWPRPRPRPRSRGFGLGLASISLSYYVIGIFRAKIV